MFPLCDIIGKFKSSCPEVLHNNNIRGGISQIGEWMPATLLTQHSTMGMFLGRHQYFQNS